MLVGMIYDRTHTKLMSDFVWSGSSDAKVCSDLCYHAYGFCRTSFDHWIRGVSSLYF